MVLSMLVFEHKGLVDELDELEDDDPIHPELERDSDAFDVELEVNAELTDDELEATDEGEDGKLDPEVVEPKLEAAKAEANELAVNASQEAAKPDAYPRMLRSRPLMGIVMTSRVD